MRPSLRAAVAVFAILLNTVLAPAWSVAFAGAGPSDWPICLAEAGADHENRPAAPVETLHCNLCLLPGPPAAAAMEPVWAMLPPSRTTRIHYSRVHCTAVTSRAREAFDARAPPADSRPHEEMPALSRAGHWH